LALGSWLAFKQMGQEVMVMGDLVLTDEEVNPVMKRLAEGGGDIHTRAQITGKAASMGEGVMVGVLDGLITDFTTKLGRI